MTRQQTAILRKSARIVARYTLHCDVHRYRLPTLRELRAMHELAQNALRH